MRIILKHQQGVLMAKRLTCFFVLALFLHAGQVMAGNTTLIEIFFLPHRPALDVVTKVEKIAAEFDNMVIKKYNFNDPAAKTLLKKYNLTGHIPVAIFINGQNTFTVNGEKIILRNFTRGNAFVPTFAGEWDYDDLRVILQKISGAK